MDRLSEPVKSKIVVPILCAQDFWKDEIVHEVAVKVVDARDGAENVKYAANETLGLLRCYV